MAIINTGFTEAGLRSEFQDAFESASKSTIWQDIVTVLKSDKDEEKYAWMGSVPQLREWGTGRVARPLFSESYSIKNLKYESTIEVDRDEISDDQIGSIRMRTRALGDRAAGHKDKLIADLLVNGATAGFNAYDGKTFFATDHQSGNSGAQSNDITSAAVIPGAPTVAEIKTAIKAGFKTLMGLADDQGEPMNLSTTGLMAVTPPEVFIDFSEALQAQTINATQNVLAGAARVVAFSRITVPSVFYLLKTDVAVRPFILQDREPLEFHAMEQNSDEGFMREKFFYGVRARYRLTYGLWQHAVRITFV